MHYEDRISEEYPSLNLGMALSDTWDGKNICKKSADIMSWAFLWAYWDTTNGPIYIPWYQTQTGGFGNGVEDNLKHSMKYLDLFCFVPL